MPFIQQSDMVNNGIPSGLLTQILAKGVDFTECEKSAAATVTDITGASAPESVADRPAWVVLPMVWIVWYIMLNAVPDKDAKEIETAGTNYDRAISLLRTHKVAPVAADSSASTTDAMEGMLAL